MIYRFVSVFCCLLLAFQMIQTPVNAQQNSTSTPPDQTSMALCKQPCLEDGTPIKLRIAQTVSSADAHVNDRVEFEVLEEIRISSVLIVPKGGIALGTVTEAQPKRRMARGGKLEIVMDSVRLADGQKAALRATKGGNGGGHTGAMTVGIVATALICFVCAPLFLLMHGKDITIPKGTEVPTFVDGNMPLDLAKFQEAASPSEQTEATPTPSGGVPGSVNQADAGIEITSVPVGADVELDGSFIGNTPSTIGVSPGDHTIGVKKSGYKPWERKIKVTSGNVTISAELEPEVKLNSTGANPTLAPELKDNTSTPENLGTVFFTSEPPGAEVYVDNSSVGKAPITLNLKAGQHYVRMFEKDYKNWSQQVTVAAGSQANVAATLEKPN
jgi:hypothetical protein